MTYGTTNSFQQTGLTRPVLPVTIPAIQGNDYGWGQIRIVMPAAEVTPLPPAEEKALASVFDTQKSIAPLLAVAAGAYFLFS